MNSAAAGVQLLDRIKMYVIDPVLVVIFTLGLLLFFVGIVEFLWSLKSGEVKSEGKQHMVYGLVGMLIMVSVYGIINLIVNTLQIDRAVDVSRLQNVNPGINFYGK